MKWAWLLMLSSVVWAAEDCAECHADIAASYARTGMGRSFRSVGPGDNLAHFDGAEFEHAPSRERFTVLTRDGRNLIRRTQPASVEARVDYVIGSGSHAFSY